VFLVDYGGMDLLEMANTRGKRPSPDVRPPCSAAPKRHADAAWGQLSQTLGPGPRFWLTSAVHDIRLWVLFVKD
jgi:hypothetical protein